MIVIRVKALFSKKKKIRRTFAKYRIERIVIVLKLHSVHYFGLVATFQFF